MSSPLPEPENLTVELNADSKGITFEIRHGRESIFETDKPVMNRTTAERRGRAWIARYRASTKKERCRMCGFDWTSVRRYLRRKASEGVAV